MNWGLVTDRYTVGLISDISSMMETACGGEGERDSVFFFTTLEIFYGNEKRERWSLHWVCIIPQKIHVDRHTHNYSQETIQCVASVILSLTHNRTRRVCC